jgi:predicted phage tail protein
MLRNVRLYGPLAEKYGKVFQLSVTSFAETIALLQANFEDFRKTIINGKYALVSGESIDKFDKNLHEDEVCMSIGNGDFHIIPEGCGGSGVLYFLAGAVLTVAGVYFEQPWLTNMGVSLMLYGAASYLAPSQDGISDNEDPDQKKSIVYNGGVNNVEQGGPVPLVYGQVMAGSILISADIDVIEYASRTLGTEGQVIDFIGA